MSYICYSTHAWKFNKERRHVLYNSIHGILSNVHIMANYAGQNGRLFTRKLSQYANDHFTPRNMLSVNAPLIWIVWLKSTIRLLFNIRASHFIIKLLIRRRRKTCECLTDASPPPSPCTDERLYPSPARGESASALFSRQFSPDDPCSPSPSNLSPPRRPGLFRRPRSWRWLKFWPGPGNRNERKKMSHLDAK